MDGEVIGVVEVLVGSGLLSQLVLADGLFVLKLLEREIEFLKFKGEHSGSLATLTGTTVIRIHKFRDRRNSAGAFEQSSRAGC